MDPLPHFGSKVFTALADIAKKEKNLMKSNKTRLNKLANINTMVVNRWWIKQFIWKLEDIEF